MKLRIPHTVASLAVLAALIPQISQAQDEAEVMAAASEPSVYLSVLGTYLRPDDARGPNPDVQRGAGFELLYGTQYSSGFGWEAQLFGDIIETGANNGTDYYRPGLGVDGFYAFGDRSGFTPFVLLGIGGAYDDAFPDERDDYAFYANAGVGFVTAPLTERGSLKLRGELRYVYDDFESGYSDYKAGLGIEIPLFAPREDVAISVEQTTRVVEVPTGLLDTDGDGVIDEADQCPDTPPDTRVDGQGCTLPDVIDLEGVTFEFDSARLRPDAETILDWAADILKKYPDMVVEVAGHTDSLGPEAYNLKLSQQRAEAVRDYLIAKGAGAAQMTAKGYGESEPKASNDTEAGRERNRRVELRVQN